MSFSPSHHSLPFFFPHTINPSNPTRRSPYCRPSCPSSSSLFYLHQTSTRFAFPHRSPSRVNEHPLPLFSVSPCFSEPTLFFPSSPLWQIDPIRTYPAPPCSCSSHLQAESSLVGFFPPFQATVGSCSFHSPVYSFAPDLTTIDNPPTCQAIVNHPPHRSTFIIPSYFIYFIVLSFIISF